MFSCFRQRIPLIYFFPDRPPSASCKGKPVSCVYFYVPLPFLSQPCWYPGFSRWLAERGRSHAVRPADPEPAVLGGDSRAPHRSRLPSIPPASAHPAAKLRHRFHGSAASHGELLWLPASPPTPCLATGIYASASTHTGECASSHTWYPELVDPEHLELGFHVEMPPTQPASPFWSMLVVPAYRSWSVLFTSCAESCGAQKGSWTRRTCVPRTGGNGPLSSCCCRGRGRASPPAGRGSLWWWLGAGKPRGKEAGKSGPGGLASLLLLLWKRFLSYPFISIFLELIGGSSQNIKEEAKPLPLYSPLPWGLWPPTPTHR